MPYKKCTKAKSVQTEYGGPQTLDRILADLSKISAFKNIEKTPILLQLAEGRRSPGYLFLASNKMLNFLATAR